MHEVLTLKSLCWSVQERRNLFIIVALQYAYIRLCSMTIDNIIQELTYSSAKRLIDRAIYSHASAGLDITLRNVHRSGKEFHLYNHDPMLISNIQAACI